MLPTAATDPARQDTRQDTGEVQPAHAEALKHARKEPHLSVVDTSLRCSGKATPIAANVSSGAALFSGIVE